MQITIDGKPWAIEFKRIHDIKRGGDVCRVYGYCYHSERLIEIDDRLKGAELYATLFHEVWHACHPKGQHRQLHGADEAAGRLVARVIADRRTSLPTPAVRVKPQRPRMGATQCL